jgi:hypothetical protein
MAHATDGKWYLSDPDGDRVLGHTVITVMARRSDDNVWTCDCELGVFGYGSSLGEALDDLTQAVTVHLNTIERLGVRDSVFAQCGLEFIAPGRTDQPVKKLGAYVGAYTLATSFAFSDVQLAA